jgi:hypothetical protein
MDSDTDSEHDRRAYGQYTSLDVDGDENVDEDAAAYLRAVRLIFLFQFSSQYLNIDWRALLLNWQLALVHATHFQYCRTEARAFPDVMVSPNHFVAASSPVSDGEPNILKTEIEGAPATKVTSSPAWIRQFMKDFLDLRLKLQR